MINVIDRQPRKPNRVRLISETDGSSKFYVIDRADEPIIQGTPLNKALFDSIDTDLKNRYTKTEADNNVNNKLKGYYDKPQMDVMLSERNMIKKNLSVTPITNADSTTNVMYPFKYTLPFEHVTAEDIAEASIAINTECPEFQGTNTINGAVELLFNDQPKSPVLFSYVSVSNAKGTTDTLIQRVADIENNKNNITTNTQDITKLKNDINTLSNIKADGIVCATESKLINVKDSSNSAFNEFNVYGESSQAPSPSPEHPQEIVNKTINEIKVTGKNLIGENAKYITYSSGIGQITNQNAVVLPFKPTSETSGIGYTVMCEKGKSYTFSVTNPNENAVVGITEYSNIEDMYNLTKKIGYAFPTPNKATYTAKTNGFLLCYIAGKWTDGSTTTHACTDTELLQVEFGSTPTPYEPYKEQKVTLSQPITLCGLKSEQGNVTIDGQKYISDVIAEKNGVYGVEKNCNEKLYSGSETEGIRLEGVASGSEVNTIAFSGKADDIKKFGDGMCNRFSDNLKGGFYSLDKEGFNLEAGQIRFRILRTKLATQDVNGIKTFLKNNNIKVVYQINTPTFEPLPIADQQALKQLHSFYPNTIITNNDNAFMKLNYVADTKMYIDNKIAEIVNQKVV